MGDTPPTRHGREPLSTLEVLLQVLRDRRAAHVHPVANLPHRASGVPQAPEHAPAGGVSKGIDGSFYVRDHPDCSVKAVSPMVSIHRPAAARRC